MLNVFIRSGDGRTVTATDSASLSAAFNDPSAHFWVDFFAPAEAEYALLTDLFGFHPLAVEDVVHEVQRPKLESYALVGDRLKTDYFFLIHGPDLDPNCLFHTSELDTFFSERYIVTIHEEPLVSVKEMFARVQSGPEHQAKWEVDILLYELLDRLMDQYVPILDALAIISVVTLPLTVITSFFGMNFADTIPGFTKPLTFIAAILLMVCLPFVFLYLFRKKDWL